MNSAAVNSLVNIYVRILARLSLDRSLEVGLLGQRMNRFAVLFNIAEVPSVGATQFCIPTRGNESAFLLHSLTSRHVVKTFGSLPFK